MGRGQFLLRVERVVEGADDCLFDLGTAEFRARRRQHWEVEIVGIAIALGQMYAKDLTPFLVQRQVNVEDLVQPPFAQQFGRQLGNVVGGGDHEDGRVLFGKPREEGAKHARRGAAIRHARSFGSR